jgi:hypothetical protein
MFSDNQRGDRSARPAATLGKFDKSNCAPRFVPKKSILKCTVTDQNRPSEGYAGCGIYTLIDNFSTRSAWPFPSFRQQAVNQPKLFSVKSKVRWVRGAWRTTWRHEAAELSRLRPDIPENRPETTRARFVRGPIALMGGARFHACGSSRAPSRDGSGTPSITDNAPAAPARMPLKAQVNFPYAPTAVFTNRGT